jgi:phosphomethylpyrimidine synthase
MTVHAGLNRQTLETVRQSGRTLGIVSRGGALLADWMSVNKKENPLFENFDELLDIAAEYDVTLSLGDALRPGCIADATDQAQIEELFALGELAQRAQKKGVQVMIEGPGHIPLDQIASNIKLQKSICRGAPFYVLGPVVCDVAPGYDHITAAVGASIAALNGADFLCYVTPAEHLRLPTLEDVRRGIIATKIAAFSADLARGKKYALNHNTKMAKARANLDWSSMAELALDKEYVLNYRDTAEVKTDRDSCSMCGDFCSIKLYKDCAAS